MEEVQENRRRTDPIMLEIRENQIEILSQIKQFTRAFPVNEFGEPDFDGHRNYHKQLIEESREARETRQAAVNKVVSVGVGGAVTILAYALWDYLKAQLK